MKYLLSTLFVLFSFNQGVIARPVDADGNSSTPTLYEQQILKIQQEYQIYFNNVLKVYENFESGQVTADYVVKALDTKPKYSAHALRDLSKVITYDLKAGTLNSNDLTLLLTAIYKK